MASSALNDRISSRKKDTLQLENIPYFKEIVEDVPKSIEDIEKEEILPLMLLISVVFSLLLGTLFAILDLISVPFSSSPASEFIISLVHLIICPVFSYGLLLAYVSMKKGLRKTTYVSGFISSIVLIIAGGFWAQIGGGIAFIVIILYLIKVENVLEV